MHHYGAFRVHLFASLDVFRRCPMSSLCSRVNSAQNQLGPNQVGPKPTRPKTKSAQTQLGPALDYEILLLSSSLTSFLLLSFSSSFIVCIMPWEFISLKEVSWSKNFGNLEYCRPNFQTVCYCDVNKSILFGMGMSQRIHFWYHGVLKMLIFFSRKWPKKSLFLFKRFLERLKNWKFKLKIQWLENHVTRDFFFFKSFFFKFLILIGNL